MKTKTKWKKLLSLLLICMMLVSLLPTVAFAAEQTLNASKNGTGWEYDHDTKTLTLTDYTGTDLFHSDFDLTVNLAGNNTINYDGTTASQYYPIYAKNVTFTGSGTLNIILSTGNKDFYLNLAGVRALEKITLKNGVALNIIISNEDQDSKVYGMYSNKGINITDSANLNVEITTLKGKGYGLYSNEGEISFDGNGTKTVTLKSVETTPTAEGYLLYNNAFTEGEKNGNITIKGSGKTTLKGNSTSYAIYSYGRNINTNGTFTIEDTEVEIDGGYFGIANFSRQRTQDAPDIIVRNSTLTIKNVERGMGTALNGILFDNSSIDISATACAVYLDKIFADYNNPSNYGLQVTGGRPIVLTTNTTNASNCYAIYNKQNDSSKFDFTNGGSIILQGNIYNVSQWRFAESSLGSNTVVSKGQINAGEIGPVYDEDMGRCVLKLEYNSGSSSAGDAETPTINAHPLNATYIKDVTATPLSVSASVSDGGTLSYQWYKNGSTIEGATSTSHTPDTSAVGSATYYCVVTNTNSSATGNKTATAQSDTATITVNAHTHDWSSTWNSDGTHHWHTCNAVGCDISNVQSAENETYKPHDYSTDTDDICDTCSYNRGYAEFGTGHKIFGETYKDIGNENVLVTLFNTDFVTAPTEGKNVSAWFENLPTGLNASVKSWDATNKKLVITLSGTPTVPSDESISIVIPGNELSRGADVKVRQIGISKYEIRYDAYPHNQGGGFVVTGTVGTAYTGTDSLWISILGDTLTNISNNEDITSWITNIPNGMKANIPDNTGNTFRIVFSGTPTEAVTAPIAITIPGENLKYHTEPLVVKTEDNVKFNITAGSGGTPLTFADSESYDIPAGTKDVTYTATTALTATGGTAPYTFRVDPAVAGLSINSENKLVYTRPAVQDATTATIKVTDSESASQTITIDIGAVEAPAAPKTLSSIEVTTAPTKTTYTAGENFDPAGMEVTATYSDGSTQDVTSSVTVSGGNSLTTDKTSVTISYTEGEVTKTTTQNITVNAPVKTLSSIAVTTAPTKTTYTAGENFDPAGMVVTATYSDGSTNVVTATVTDGNALTAGKTSVTISYTEGGVTKTTTQNITVNAAPKTLSSIAVTTAPTKTTYTAGENFDPAGMVVTATYSDDSTNVVTATVTDGDNLNAGKTSVTISYTEGEVTKTTTQAITVNEGSSVTPPAPPASGGGSGFSGKYNYPVVIDTDDHAAAKADKNHAVAGDKVTITISPEAGYAVDEVIITDKDNKVITVSKAGDNTYSFTMPEGKVSVSISTEKATYSLKLVLQIGNKNIVANGKPFAYDTAPIIDANDRTLVPIRVITEQLGGQVDWNEKLQTVTLKLDGKMYVMTIGQTIPGFDTAAIIDENGRTLVPVRYVAEKLGARVDWIAATRQIVITK